ncbi:MAG: hypothetical protein E6G83_20160 [Alphaproteobacteria bacterium]|nr:MAG: hypothetical protein E6G83_20160 [Alphaproteobacteria bacterium]
MAIHPKCSAWRISSLRLVSASFFAALVALSPAKAEEQSKCVASPHLLWGDGEHDDTAALNAWFRGETVVWAQTHEKVGAEIADHTFLLSSVVYISSGTGRTLERFRMIWPERQETVSGGTIRSGDDPDKPPVAEGVTTIGADPDEGVPYEGPPSEPLDHGVPRHCLTS